ncbi:MAG: SseB family protein [Lachnospiraceae bacterium]|nr:SseB family protein [Lachnospiraceae bacterium]
MGLFDFFKKKNKEEVGTPVEEASRAEQTADSNEAAAKPEMMGDTDQEAGMAGQVSAGGQEADGAAATPTSAEAQEAGAADQPFAGGQAAAGQQPFAGTQAAGGAAAQPLTPEQLAARKAEQEELARKRDEDGKVLAYLIDRHHELKTKESFQAAIKSLTEVFLCVPMRMQFSSSDTAAMQAAKQEGRKVEPKDPVRLAPSLMKTKEGELIYAAFSNRDEIPKELQNKFVWVQMPSGQCAHFVVINKNISAMVINPHSKSLVLKRDLLEKLVKPV